MFFNKLISSRRKSSISKPNITNLSPEQPSANTSSLKLNTKNTILEEFYIYQDFYFVDAAKLIIDNNKASIGLLQRHFKIGFNRAMKIMNELYEAGIVGEEEGTKPRKILMSMDEFEKLKLNWRAPQVPQNANSNTTDEVTLEKTSPLMQLDVIADFSNDGKFLQNLQNMIIYNCTEIEQHNLVNKLLTFNSSKTLKLIIFDENAFSYTNYNLLPQMLMPVISDSSKLLSTINFLKAEMTNRLHTFADYRCQNLYSYNSKANKTLPTIVFIISEFYLVKTYFGDNIIQLLLNGNKAGIYLFMFSQFDIKHFSSGIMKDLIEICNTQQAQQIIDSNLDNNISINGSQNIHAIDEMNGQQFEKYCANLLKKNGFSNIEVTQGSGDHGIDILAEKDDISYAIQCKCYSSNIGNAAVQQAHTGKSIYCKDIAVVMTNRYFTQQAINEATTLGVKLWDRNKLNYMIEKSK